MIRERPIDSPLADDPEAIRRAVERVLAACPSIICAHLFGSRATGDHGPLSDIDVAYASRVPPTMMEEADLLYEIGRALGTHEVDLVNLRSISLRSRLAVLEEGRPLFVRNPEAVADLLAATRLEYFDFVPYEREYDQAFLQNLKAAVVTVDRDRIRRGSIALRDNVDKLRALSQQDLASFTEDFRSHHAAMRLLQISIEDMINVGNHIIARRSYRKPNDSADVFRVLAESGMVSAGEAERLERAARFRNRLVHVYWDIDLKEVLRFLTDDIEDFEVFAERIGRVQLEEGGAGAA